MRELIETKLQGDWHLATVVEKLLQALESGVSQSFETVEDFQERYTENFQAIVEKLPEIGQKLVEFGTESYQTGQDQLKKILESNIQKAYDSLKNQ